MLPTAPGSANLLRPVAALRRGVLERLATWIHGRPVGIEILAGAKRPVTVVAATRTLVLHPDVRLFELLLGAELVAWPEEKAALGSGAERRRNVRHLLERAALRLRQRFARFAVHDGLLRPERFALRRESAPMEPIRLMENVPSPRIPSHWQLPSDRWILADCKFAGLAEPLEELVRRIEEGAVPLQTLPDFPDVPFYVVQIRVGSRTTIEPDPHRLQRLGVVPSIVESLTRCIRQTGEGIELQTPPERAVHVGIDLQQDRLAEARAALRLGHSFPIFSEPDEPPSLFRPERHLVGLFFDLDGLSTMGKLATRTRPGFIATLLRSYEALGIRTIAHAFEERVIPCGKRKVHLHLDYVLQSADEGWSGAFWERLETVLARTHDGLGSPGKFCPLHFSRLATELRGAARDSGDVVLTPLLFEGRHFPTEAGVADAGRRYAAALDRMAERLHRQVGEFQGDAYLLPPSVAEHLTPSGRIRRGCIGNRGKG